MEKISFDELVSNPLLSNIDSFADRNAFYIKGTYYTYKQFADCISKIRHALKPHSDKVYIGLVANDDLETYASIFATWLEGKCYVPLHPEQPLDRINEIINDTNIELILNSFPAPIFPNKKVINTDLLTYESDLFTYKNNISDEMLAYILFTSGSTGKPKGVAISRKNLGAFIDSFWDCSLVITENDRCLQCFDLTFDASVQGFLVPLLKGACVYTVPYNEIKYTYVSDLLEEHQLTIASVAQSMLRFLRPYFREINLPKMRYCLLVAEASSLDLIDEWSTCIPNAQIFNFYGPTEATVYCTYYEMSRTRPNKSLNGMLSIGVPMKNVNAIIINENNNILPYGEKGELCVSGDQLFPGYWNNPEKNATVFFEKELNGTVNCFYRTGDLCYFDNDGILMLYGRLDSQAKIQGYRVELGEIEFHARNFLKGHNAVVLVFSNKSGNNELALFVESEKVNKSELISYLKKKLPSYMIPAKIFFEREFPLNANSKVDKIKLKQKIEIMVS